MVVVSGGRPWPGLAAMLLLLSMGLFVASLASSRWIENQGVGRQLFEGPFEACVRDFSLNIRECHRVDNTCMTSFSDPIGDTVTGANCHMVRATRAFLILGLIFAGIAFLWSWLAYNAIYDDIMYRVPAILSSLASMVFGLIGWSIYVGMVQHSYPSSDWTYGWGTGLGIGAWLLPLAATLANMIPSPARDWKTGEIIARDSMRRRRGSWADVFTRDFWTKGADWGGHDPGFSAERGGAGAPYDDRRGAPPGVGYRESAGSPHHRDDPREREALRESERERPGGMTTGGVGPGRFDDRGTATRPGEGLFQSERERELAREQQYRGQPQSSGTYYNEPLTHGLASSSKPGSRETSTAQETMGTTVPVV